MRTEYNPVENAKSRFFDKNKLASILLCVFVVKIQTKYKFKFFGMAYKILLNELNLSVFES